MAAKTKSKDLKTVKVSGIVRQEGKLYSAWCPELDVASQGDTVEEAHSNLGDAVELYLNTLVGLGEIDRVLAERGLSGNVKAGRPALVYLTSWDVVVR